MGYLHQMPCFHFCPALNCVELISIASGSYQTKPLTHYRGIYLVDYTHAHSEYICTIYCFCFSNGFVIVHIEHKIHLFTFVALNF